MPYSDAEKVRLKNRNYHQAMAKANTAFLRTLKEALPCADCGKNFPHYVMEFDHVRGLKSFTVTSKADCSTKAMLSELDKCDIVCANCHKVREWSRRNADGVYSSESERTKQRRKSRKITDR